ncbi:kelch-like protein 18 [Littorina saxatilis]|uniref:kelch-like protein 18 n=1 Tax=Littorina saxatilis TaxID=31220 RepID=UPI0038B42AED
MAEGGNGPCSPIKWAVSVSTRSRSCGRDGEDTVLFKQADLPAVAFPTIADIRRQGKLCDVTLKVGDQRFSAHRVILAATIPYFNAMFTHDMVEANMSEITMEGIEPSALEALVNFSYTGSVTIDRYNAQSLLIAASFLHLNSVRDACCTFFKDRLHISNCVSVRTFADQYMCADLVEAANKFIHCHFKQVTLTDDFLCLPKDDVLHIISKDELNVCSEEEVFEAVLDWIRHRESVRKGDIAELMVQVRLPLLTPPYLSDRVATENIIKNSLQCRDLLDEARDYLLMPERRTLLQTFKTRPRCCTDIPGVVYAIGGLTPSGSSLNTTEMYDPVTGKWAVTESMVTTRSRVGTAVMNGKLYAIGGYNGSDRLCTVEMFDPATRAWKMVGPMNCKRSALGAAAVGGKLLVSGGYDGISSLNSVEIYDVKTDKWVLVAPMKCHRSASGMAVLEGEIYCCGGHDGLSIFDSVECYDCTLGTWRDVPPMRSKRCRLGVATLKGKLYAIGGYDGAVFQRTVERYDTETGKWTDVAPMNIKRSRVAVAATYGKLFAIGGYDGQTKLSSTEMYDPDLNKWVFVAPMIAHEGGVGVGIVPNCESSMD